jgi:hypothetical protein
MKTDLSRTEAEDCGASRRDTPATPPDAADVSSPEVCAPLERMVNAIAVRVTDALAPASLGLALVDWAVHLATNDQRPDVAPKNSRKLDADGTGSIAQPVGG